MLVFLKDKDLLDENGGLKFNAFIEFGLVQDKDRTFSLDRALQCYSEGNVVIVQTKKRIHFMLMSGFDKSGDILVMDPEGKLTAISPENIDSLRVFKP